MKKLFTLLAMLCVAFSTYAQTPLFKAGDEVVSLGVGVGSSSYGTPFVASYEMGFKDLNEKSTIGIGGSIGYQYENLNDETGNMFDKYAYSGLTIAAVGSYHYDLVDGFDLFASVSLGYTMAQISAKKNDVKGSEGYNDFYYGLSVGGRYYFADGLAAYAKVGATATSVLELGVSYRFSVKSLVNKYL